MDSSACIEQKGVVKDISNGLVKVNITSFSACANCHSKQACGLFDQVEKEIDIPKIEAMDLEVGDGVRVIMKRTMGWKAALLGYFFPFMLVLTTLLILHSLKLNELLVGLGSLMVLIPYFTVLYLSRERLRNTFSFTIRKIV